MKIVLGSDHAGFECRRSLADLAKTWGHETFEVGSDSTQPYDYPDASDLVSQAVLEERAELGVLVCGTGIGVSIRANRHSGIRAAVCCSTKSAELARLHNHANVLCLGARTIELAAATDILRTFLETREDHDDRHDRRVRKLDGDDSASAVVVREDTLHG